MAHQVTLQEAQMKLPELVKEAIDGGEVVVVQDKKILVHLGIWGQYLGSNLE